MATFLHRYHSDQRIRWRQAKTKPFSVDQHSRTRVPYHFRRITQTDGEAILSEMVTLMLPLRLRLWSSRAAHRRLPRVPANILRKRRKHQARLPQIAPLLSAGRSLRAQQQTSHSLVSRSTHRLRPELQIGLTPPSIISRDGPHFMAEARDAAKSEIVTRRESAAKKAESFRKTGHSP